ncbi:MAG: hypothetical protein QOJ66_654 [Ilumatobacteraceae bacterium]
MGYRGERRTPDPRALFSSVLRIWAPQISPSSGGERRSAPRSLEQARRPIRCESGIAPPGQDPTHVSSAAALFGHRPERRICLASFDWRAWCGRVGAGWHDRVAREV